MPKAKILIVEDETIVARDIQKSVEAMGYLVCAMASSGEEAIKKADETIPDLALMDIVLKGNMDGVQAAEQIGTRFKIPIVYLTAYDDEDILHRAKITTPFGYIVKPFNDRELRIAIEIALYKNQVEVRMRKTELWLAAVLRSVGDGVITSDREGRITFMNQMAEKLTGWKLEDALGRKQTEVLNIKDAGISNLEKHLVEKVITEGLIINLLENRMLIAKDGTEIPISDSLAPIREDNGETPGTVLVFRDVTDRKQAEEEKANLQDRLFQSQKIESVGRLAGGVAHDFNNMLGVIIGHSEIALNQMDASDPLHAGLTEILKAANRSADLTRQLLAFARKQTISPKIMDLNKTVVNALKMLQRLIGEDIRLDWQPETDLWPIKMDPTQIDQILTNLCLNARDAISGVGKMIIETGNSAFDEAYCADHAGFLPGEYVLLAVSDNGCGMDKETLGKLFEPFFTTKDLGKGTGLGLAMIYGIVKQNDGFITVYSEPDQGTTFKIYLPRHSGKAEGALKEAERQKPAMRGRETVLVVEDEPALLSLSKLMLEEQGYRVLAAGTPGEALRLVEGYAGEVHLLMTDVVMPEMNGLDLSKKMLSLYPNLKCLFTSGYTSNVIVHHGVLDEGIYFLQKPFSRRDLAAKVREALDQK